MDTYNSIMHQKIQVMYIYSIGLYSYETIFKGAS